MKKLFRMLKGSAIGLREILFLLLLTFLIVFLNTFVNDAFIYEGITNFKISMLIRWLIANLEGIIIILIIYKVIMKNSNRKTFSLVILSLLINSFIFLSIYLNDK
jgi:hypothetical protein